jgi:hypothetical protein
MPRPMTTFLAYFTMLSPICHWKGLKEGKNFVVGNISIIIQMEKL